MTLPALLRRSGASLASQVMNSASNLLLSVVVAREVAPTAYGGWAVAYAAFVMLLTVSRAVVSTPVLLLPDTGRPQELQSSLKDSISAAAALGCASGIALVAASSVSGEALGQALLALGLFMPFLIVLDALRYGYFSERRPTGAVWLDAIALGSQGTLFGLAVHLESANVFTLTASWATGSGIAAVLGICRRRCVPGVAGIRRHFRQHRWGATRLLADATLTALAANALPVVVGALVGLTASGYLRAGQTLMGAVGLLVTGMMPLMTVEAVRLFNRDRSPWPALWAWTVGVGVLASALGLVFLNLPDAAGRELLGASWSGAQVILLPLVIQTIVRGPFTGVPVLLKASGHLNEMVRLRVRISLVSLGFPTLGAALAGLEGAAWGLVAAATWANYQCLTTLRKKTHNRQIIRAIHVSEVKQPPNDNSDDHQSNR